ncbi:MAG: BlaI/MecI/CopY family transcriptional regulator [Planctomycetota bacterium]
MIHPQFQLPTAEQRVASKVRLSAGEMDLMDLLWRDGPLTLAQAHARFGVDQIGYTTIQTRLNRLVEKGFAVKSGRPAHYEAGVKRADVRAGHLDQLISKLAGGSVVPLVAQLMQDRRISDEELDELKRLIDGAEPIDAKQGSPRARKPDQRS